MGIVLVERTALAYLAELDVLDGRPQDAITHLHPAPVYQRRRSALRVSESEEYHAPNATGAPRA